MDVRDRTVFTFLSRVSRSCGAGAGLQPLVAKSKRPRYRGGGSLTRLVPTGGVQPPDVHATERLARAERRPAVARVLLWRRWWWWSTVYVRSEGGDADCCCSLQKVCPHLTVATSLTCIPYAKHGNG